MQIFACPACGGPVFFDNLLCACGAAVAYEPEAQHFVAAAATCANREAIGCNWAAAGGLCHSCAMTEVVPDIADDANRFRWGEAEAAKRWVLANLARWDWLTAADPGARPVFEMLAEATSTGPARVTMGHADGRVTINVNEADPATRVARRVELGEPYRTMIGHFRHELGHFFFERLGEKSGFTTPFRALFGDERADYGEALKAHYAKGGALADAAHITGYATSHPHEDWAESFAHLLHLVDIADSFVAAGLTAPELAGCEVDPYSQAEGGPIVSAAAGLSIALNHVNRAMGLPDVYPFVLTPAVRDKLAFVHGWMRPGPAPATATEPGRVANAHRAL